MIEALLKSIVSAFFRVEVHGLDHLKAAGDRVMIVANHLATLDALLLVLYLPTKSRFLVNANDKLPWYVNVLPKLFATCVIAKNNPLSIRSAINVFKPDETLVAFPGECDEDPAARMKSFEACAMIADKAGATLLPIRLDGAQHSLLSRIKDKVPVQWFPKITLTVQAPLPPPPDDSKNGRMRRARIANQMYDLTCRLLMESLGYQKPLFQSLIDQTRVHGRRHIIAEDATRATITYGGFLTKSYVLGGLLARRSEPGDFVGIMLPNTITSVVVFFALQAFGRVPAMINFSAGARNVISACRTAEIDAIYSSKQFIEVGELGPLVEALEGAGITIHYLEDMAGDITLTDKIKGLAASFFPEKFYRRNNNHTADDPAVVLFTSGSEGMPKGVVLSHRNMQANRQQLTTRLDFDASDVIFNSLPIFHSFGLTGGTILPMLTGMKTFLYPSPLHYRIIPELVWESKTTIMFGTDTFLAGYARFAKDHEFDTVRYVVAGAEKLKNETRKLWAEKYDVQVYEAYGATETSPGICINTSFQNRKGSVGRILPGIDHQLQTVAGIDHGGKLVVKGPNIMNGYILPDKPGLLQPPGDGWYDTGDIVSIDDDGFVTIVGRAKRFAKIAGEMISLTAVEALVSELWPDHNHAVVSIPDDRKGEALVLMTDNPDSTREELLSFAKKKGITELSVPRKIKMVDAVPLLGSGKTDYVAVQKLWENSYFGVVKENKK